jgi:hypothetical protein
MDGCIYRKRSDADYNQAGKRSTRHDGGDGMSAIDSEMLAMFNELYPAGQGQILDLMQQLLEEQRAAPSV